MSHHWFCKVSGKQVGPLSSQQLKAMAAQGKLHPDDFIRQGEEGQWVAASRVKGLFPSQGAAKTTPAERPAEAPAERPATAAAPLFSMMGGPVAQQPAQQQPAPAPAAPAPLFSMTAPLPEEKPSTPAPLFSMLGGPVPQQPVSPAESRPPLAETPPPAPPATLFSMTAPLPEQPTAPPSLFPQEPPSLFAGVATPAVPIAPPGIASRQGPPMPPPLVSSLPVKPIAESSAVIPLDLSAPRSSGAPIAGPTTDAIDAAKILEAGDLNAQLLGRRKKRSQLSLVFISALFAVVAALGWLAWKVYRSQTADQARQAAAVKSKSGASAEQLSAEVEKQGIKQGATAKKPAAAEAKPVTPAKVKWYDAASADFTYGERNVSVGVQSVRFGTPQFLLGTDIDSSKQQSLLIALEIKNTSDQAKAKYETWAARGKPSCVKLTDNLGKTYAEKSFGTQLADGQFTGRTIEPGKTGEDLLFFEVPDKKQVRFLRLELPAANFGGQGTVNFEIPRAMLGRTRQAMIAEAAKRAASGGAKSDVDLDDEIAHPKGINLDLGPGGPASMVLPDKGKGGSRFDDEVNKPKLAPLPDENK
jgi:hypothetical protein